MFYKCFIIGLLIVYLVMEKTNKETKKLRGVYMKDAFYQKQVAKADSLGMTFSSYVCSKLSK